MAVGCTSLGSFSSRFTEIVGETPTAYRQPGARRGQRDAGVRREDADAPGAQSIEQDRRSGGVTTRLASSVMTIALQYTNITVNDVDESIAFYGDALGLEVQERRDVGRVPLGHARQRRAAGLGIVLSVPHAGRSQADGDTLQELLTKGVLPIPGLRSDDVDAMFETVRSSGAEVLQEPIDQGWGPRDCAFRDPSGNMVRISQAPPV